MAGRWVELRRGYRPVHSYGTMDNGVTYLPEELFGAVDSSIHSRAKKIWRRFVFGAVFYVVLLLPYTV